jgi:DNA polymerase III subunit gamma/tau
MVKPYLSRLSPAESGPRLRPRPRSRFEPAPRLPIDGPLIAGGPAWAAEAAGPQIDLEPDGPYPYPAGPAAAPGGQAPPPPRAAAPPPGQQDAERALMRAAGADGPPPGRRPRPAAAPAGETPRPAPEGSEAGFRAAPGEDPGRRERAPAPWNASRRSAPQPPRTPPGHEPVAGDLASPDGRAGAPPARPEPAPAQRLPAPPEHHVPAPRPRQAPVPRRHPDQTSLPAHPPQIRPSEPDYAELPAVPRPAPWADAPADRVQAMARWLRDADAAAGRAEAAAGLSPGPRLAPAPPGHGPGRPAVHTEVSVTIERIEIKAPAADPAPARPPSSGPRRRAPSLEDYLESRTRARGRPG